MRLMKKQLFIVSLEVLFRKEKKYMNDKDLIQHLLDTISQQHNDLMVVIGTFIAIISLGLVILGYLQVRFSNKQIEKMKSEFKDDFKIDDINKANSEVKENISQLKDYLKENKKIELSLKNQISISMNTNLGMAGKLLVNINKDTDPVLIGNNVSSIKIIFEELSDNGNITSHSFRILVLDMSKFLFELNEYNIVLDGGIVFLLDFLIKEMKQEMNNTDMGESNKSSLEYYLNLIAKGIEDMNKRTYRA